ALFRCVLTVPLATAEALSATTIVTMSSTLAARGSAPSAANRALLCQREPGLALRFCSSRSLASRTYWSSAETSVLDFFRFWAGEASASVSPTITASRVIDLVLQSVAVVQSGYAPASASH